MEIHYASEQGKIEREQRSIKLTEQFKSDPEAILRLQTPLTKEAKQRKDEGPKKGNKSQIMERQASRILFLIILIY